MIKHSSSSRASTIRGSRGFAISWLDVKLGLRMLVRQPALTAVAVFALAIGIPASLLPDHVYTALKAPMSFDPQERIVGIRLVNVAEGGDLVRTLHDFSEWREELTTIRPLAASRTDPYNVISSDGRAEPIRGAQMTASGFEALGVLPIAGRVLLPSDEMPGAPDVVVMGYDVWQNRLGGDPGLVGSTIRIGEVPHEVIGIMPEGFLFPLNDHLWLPFRHQPTDYERGMGPDVIMFGRLVEGASVEEAQAELTAIGQRTASQFPATHEHLRPRVATYTAMAIGLDGGDWTEIYMVQLIALVLLAIVCGNVGTLILARTATRAGELTMRTALGASRTRIISQLFVESLVLAVASAGIGLLLGDVIATTFHRSGIFVDAPFWLDFGVSFRTAATALGLAVFCAVIAGVLPALKATGARVQRNLQRAGTGSAIRFGIGATVLIVAEVGLAVGFLTVGGAMSQGLVANSSADMEIEPEEYALAMVRVPWTDHSALENDLRVEEFRAEVVHAHEELLRRLSAEPGVRGVAMATALPGMGHPSRLVEVEGEARGEGFQGHEVMFARVDVGFFDGLGAEIRTGRGFTTSDLIGTERERTAVIVNSAFVQYVLGGGNPIGRHIRYVVPEGQQPGPWHEIVGVVGHLGMNELNAERDEGVYHPVAPGELHPIWTAVRVGENPLSFLPRLRAVTSDVDPDAMIQFPGSLDAPPNDDRTGIGYAILLLGFLSTVAIVLSGAGLYALMSFTVSQRTREIGIRSALGARPQNIVAAIATRAFLQLVGGVLTGLAFSAWFIPQVAGDDLTRGANWPVIIAGIAGLMITVGMLACLAPTIRGLRIRPIEALKER